MTISSPLQLSTSSFTPLNTNITAVLQLLAKYILVPKSRVKRVSSFAAVFRFTLPGEPFPLAGGTSESTSNTCSNIHRGEEVCVLGELRVTNIMNSCKTRIWRELRPQGWRTSLWRDVRLLQRKIFSAEAIANRDVDSTAELIVLI
jgi:hypothetical protein